MTGSRKAVTMPHQFTRRFAALSSNTDALLGVPAYLDAALWVTRLDMLLGRDGKDTQVVVFNTPNRSFQIPLILRGIGGGEGLASGECGRPDSSCNTQLSSPRPAARGVEDWGWRTVWLVNEDFHSLYC